jgi:hypothetical protein
LLDFTNRCALTLHEHYHSKHHAINLDSQQRWEHSKRHAQAVKATSLVCIDNHSMVYKEMQKTADLL